MVKKITVKLNINQHILWVYDREIFENWNYQISKLYKVLIYIAKRKKNDFLENYPVVNVVLNVKEVNYNLEICCLKVSVFVTKECKRILCDKITATKFLVEIDMEHWYVLYFLFFFYKSSFVEVYFPNIQNSYV